MGIFNDDFPDHEGFLVALTKRSPDDYRWYELGSHPDDQSEVVVQAVQMGCECGWRSPRICAPSGTTWFPSVVCAHQEFEAYMQQFWKEHLELEGKRNPKHVKLIGDVYFHDWWARRNERKL